MQTLIEALKGNAAGIVGRFYEELSRLPKSRVILEMLAPQELEHLKIKQEQNLLSLADPQLDPQAHSDIAMRVGRIHAVVGLDKEELVRSRGILMEAVYQLIGPHVTSQALALYNRRLTADLAYQIKAYQMVQDSQQDVLLRLTQAIWTETGYTTFISRVVDILAAHDEFEACAIGRPDAGGVFQLEAAASRDPRRRAFLDQLTERDHEIMVRADHPRGQGPIGRSWRSGNVERIVNYRNDPQAANLRALALAENLRSSAAIPLGPPGRPVAVALVFSALPGGFVGPHQVAFIDLLQTLLSGAIIKLQAPGEVRRTVPIQVRQHWAALVRTGKLEMYYQPLLDLHTGGVGKVEALARLHDGGRLLSPGEFLPALVPDDLLALYSGGLERALADRSAWLAQGRDIAISINLPVAALNDIRYFEATQAALAAHACPGAKLTLEVLETGALSLQQGQLALLARFKELGVLIAQDDLGAGHSSLVRLRELPFDWIKIDRDVVKITGPDAIDALHLIYQITRLGHSLGKSVLAEGIESADLLSALGVLGVDAAQGYEVARPMPADEFLPWLDAHTPQRVDRDAGDGLTHLARFLLWEERLYLMSELPQDFAPFGAASPDLARLQRQAVDSMLGPRRDRAAYLDARGKLIAAIAGEHAA